MQNDPKHSRTVSEPVSVDPKLAAWLLSLEQEPLETVIVYISDRFVLSVAGTLLIESRIYEQLRKIEVEGHIDGTRTLE